MSFGGRTVFFAWRWIPPGGQYPCHAPPPLGGAGHPRETPPSRDKNAPSQLIDAISPPQRRISSIWLKRHASKRLWSILPKNLDVSIAAVAREFRVNKHKLHRRLAGTGPREPGLVTHRKLYDPEERAICLRHCLPIWRRVGGCRQRADRASLSRFQDP